LPMRPKPMNPTGKDMRGIIVHGVHGVHRVHRVHRVHVSTQFSKLR
jgi:hypothetical protein